MATARWAMGCARSSLQTLVSLVLLLLLLDRIQGGTEQKILPFQGPIFIPPNCDFVPGDFLGDCVPSNQQMVLQVIVVRAKSACKASAAEWVD